MERPRLTKSIEPAEARKDRRGAIRYALFRCIREKGYAATTLAEVAAAAGLSPSHLLYYYDNKDAVLEDLFAAATRHLRDDLARMPWDSVEDAFDALTEHFLGGRAFSRVELATMLQFWGLSTHHPRLREIKAEFDDDLKARLTDAFRRTKRAPGLRPHDAAETASALLSGLLSASYFSADLEPARARSLFRRALKSLTGATTP